MSNYKLPRELKKRMEREIRQYEGNKKKLDRIKNDLIDEKEYDVDSTGKKVTRIEATRRLIYLEERLMYIEKAYNRLRPFEQEVYDLIFKQGCDCVYCEAQKNISKTTYYNIYNKSVYYLAEEWGEI